MSLPRRAAAVIAAAALPLIATPAAAAATGVFGGTTRAGEAIVLRSDAKAKTLRGAVVAWVAQCDNGQGFSMAADLTSVAAEPGFQAGPFDLVVTRNAKGRFRGAQTMATTDGGGLEALVEVDVSGRLRGRRASGRLAATVTVVDAASAAPVTTCRSGSQAWSATRAPGRVFGGKTAQDEPVVVRVDRRRDRVTDLLVGWQTAGCEPPDRFFRFGERFAGLALRAGRFGGAFDESYDTDDGGTIAYAYELAGSVGRRAVTGAIQVTIAGTDAAGATDLACHSGKISWRAATG